MTTSHEIALEHCSWAKSARLSPRDIVEACGYSAPPITTWNTAYRVIRKLAATPSAFARSSAPKPINSRKNSYYYQRPQPDRSTVRDRPCMTCKKVFRSAGAHNRLCVSCRNPSGGQPLLGWEYAEPIGVDAI